MTQTDPRDPDHDPDQAKPDDAAVDAPDQPETPGADPEAEPE